MKTSIASSLSRRRFMQTGAGLALGATVGSCLAKPSEQAAPPLVPTGIQRFPENFEWGTATAALQVEGAAKLDGRGDSIWDVFSRQPGRIRNLGTPAVACDHYHRFLEDIALMSSLGVKHYRLSVSWSRVLPEGTGAINSRGLDFYQRLIDALLAHRIVPHVTLYHWDLPQALQERYGGWQSRQVARDFADYVTVVVKALGDRVDRWIPLNEICTFAAYQGYGIGVPGGHAPGVNLHHRKQRAQVIHHALLAHGLASQAIRAASPKACRISAAENFTSCIPVIETEAHIEAARIAFREDFVNGAILWPLVCGRHHPEWVRLHEDDMPDMAPGDEAIINQPLDEFGINCYTGVYVRAGEAGGRAENMPLPADYPRGGAQWLGIIPEAAYWAVRLLSEISPRRIPVYVSENGRADVAAADDKNRVLDVERIAYGRSYLRMLHRALSEGYPLTGYFHWSLLDNFEWAEGYTQRFGLVHVDFETQRRTPKLSYSWYQQVVITGQIV